MLDLQPGVHLEERRGAGVAVDQELHGARAAVADGRREPPGGRVQLGAHGVGQVGGGRLLEQLLVAALHGAVAVAEDGDGAVVVGEDLHLDVARAGDVTLEEHLAPPERGGRLAPRGGEGAGQLVGARDDPHPAAPAAVRGLDQQREADPRGGVPGLAGVDRLLRAVQHRHRALPGERPRAHLVAHGRHHLGGRADEHAGRRR